VMSDALPPMGLATSSSSDKAAAAGVAAAAAAAELQQQSNIDILHLAAGRHGTLLVIVANNVPHCWRGPQSILCTYEAWVTPFIAGRI
jgi:hypothetical protein